MFVELILVPNVSAQFSCLIAWIQFESDHKEGNFDLRAFLQNFHGHFDHVVIFTVGGSPQHSQDRDEVVQRLRWPSESPSGLYVAIKFFKLSVKMTDLYLYSSQPTILQEIIDNYTSQIVSLIEEQRVGPEQRLRDFDQYLSLINDEENQRVMEFIYSDPPHNLEEYGVLIEKFHQLSTNIPVTNEHTVFSGMFAMRRTILIENIAAMAATQKDNLVLEMVADYQQKCRL